MTDPRRRRLLGLSLSFAGVAVVGCGGASSATSAPAPGPTGGSASPAPPAAPSSPSPAAPTPATPSAPAPAATGSRQFALTSATASDAAPFCLGFAFRRGDVPDGQVAVADLASVQVTPKNRWPDGSLKFAVVAGRAPLQANKALTVSLSTAAGGPVGAALGLADLKATGISAAIGCGDFGSVSWNGADWDVPFKAWIVGPQMSSWIYRKAVGSDAHLVAWLEVRLFAGGAVEVLPWIENGYLRVAGPTNKNATYTFTLGGTQRFSAPINLLHHQRTPLVSGSAMSYWLGADPGVTPRHDVAYLQSSELVPTYRAVNTPARAAEFAQSFAPLQKGNYGYDGDVMSSPGYAGPIGLLPHFDVIYLTANGDPAAYRSVVFNAYSAGRYARYYRDETTQRAARVSQYPGLVVYGGTANSNQFTPSPSGAEAPPWASSHHPSIGYMAYLLTGRWFHVETIQFSAATQMLGTTDWIRGSGKCVINSDYEGGARGAAWKFRTLAQALSATPDDDTALRDEFRVSIENTVEHHHALYLRGESSPVAPTWAPGSAHLNPFGIVLTDPAQYKPYSDWFSTWMDDFVTAAWGYGLALGLPLGASSAARMAEFFHWKARAVVGRLGKQGDYWYVNSVPYLAAFRNNGTWYSTWAEVYGATHSRADYPDSPKPTAWMSNTEGQLAPRYGFPDDASGMWGNVQPAIAYAVRHGVAGAQESYARMTGASNWSALAAGLNTFHVWSVRPPGA